MKKTRKKSWRKKTDFLAYIHDQTSPKSYSHISPYANSSLWVVYHKAKRPDFREAFIFHVHGVRFLLFVAGSRPSVPVIILSSKRSVWFPRSLIFRRTVEPNDSGRPCEEWLAVLEIEEGRTFAWTRSRLKSKFLWDQVLLAGFCLFSFVRSTQG